MNIPIKYITDIPEDAYVQLPVVMYNSLKIQLNNFSKYALKVADGKLDIPKNEDGTKVCLPGQRLYISKSKDDPLNVVYLITYRFRTATFNEIISSFLSDYDLLFDINLFYDKNEFLNDMAQGLKHILTLQNLKFKYEYGYVELNASVSINTKNITYILE